jgi:hypothetical protein
MRYIDAIVTFSGATFWVLIVMCYFSSHLNKTLAALHITRYKVIEKVREYRREEFAKARMVVEL